MNLQTPSVDVSLNKLAVLFNNSTNGEVIRGIEVLLTAILPNNISIAFGKLVSDHAGYVCFDLSHAESTLHSLLMRHLRAHGTAPLADPGVPEADAPQSEAAPKAELALIATLRTVPEQKIDILRHGFGIVRDAILADIRLPTSALAAPWAGNGLVSIQRPSLTDWTISPGSFTINPAFFIGQDQCENLYPANFATQEFRFHQLLREDSPGSRETRLQIVPGWALEYQTTWEPLGHTLGKLVYTLPLAPGEITNIAIVDWSRKSLDSRFDDLIISEKLNHNTNRDRTISETVDATLDEWQRGGSVMGGVAGSMSYGAGSTSMGASAAIGGGYSTSSADRHVTASTVQQLSDGFSQASSAMRELRGSVVIQSAQQEHVEAKTRVVANYNHAHALTMLYYEVLRHYRVTTQFKRTRRCLLISYADRMADFNDDAQVDKYEYILKHVLLDKALLPAFDYVSKLLFYKGSFVSAKMPSDYLFTMFKLTLTTGDDGTDSDVTTSLLLKNSSSVDLFFEESDDDDKRVLDHDANWDFNSGDVDFFLLTTTNPVRWGDIAALQVKLNGGNNWSIAHVTLLGYAAEGEIILYDSARSDSLKGGVLPIATRAPTDKVVQTADGKLSEGERLKIFKLKHHLAANQLYYNRAIWLLEDPNERAIRFAATPFDGKTLLDSIDNRPLEVLGDLVAFASNNEKPAMPVFEASKSENLMSLPTRGVFAEAKLGHCSASEIIDNTRFWDWQTSPIPEHAPAIVPVSTDSRNVTQNTAPAQMPSAIINIVSPTAAPDPTGMAGALNLLGKADIFRDMSMSKEVGDLLGKLSSNSISMADAAKKAREISQGTGSGVATGTASGSGAGSAAKPGVNPNSPQQLMDWTNAIKNSSLSPEQKDKLTAALLENMSNNGIGSPAANAGFHVTPPVPFVAQPTAMTCWAAAATMLRSWKENTAFSIENVVDQAGPLYRARFDAGQGLASGQMVSFFENLNMGYEPPANYPIEFYIKLLKKYGPLWMTLDAAQSINGISPHAYILVGYKGDGTQENTRFILMEPSKPGETEYSFFEFMKKFEEMVADLGSSQALFLQIAYNLDSVSVGALPPYDRNAALVYAQTYWNRTCSDNYLFGKSNAYYFPNNPDGVIVGDKAEDCTHFVSSCIGMAPKDSVNQISGGGLFLESTSFMKGKSPQPYGFTMPKLLLDYLKLTKKIMYLNDQGALQDDLFYHSTANQTSLTVPFSDPHGDIVFYSTENKYVKPGAPFSFEHAALVVGIDPATNSKQIACHSDKRFDLPVDDVNPADLPYFVYARVIR